MMPKYLYRCSNCDEQLFVVHAISEKVADCDICNSLGTLKKLPPSFTLSKEVKEEKKIGDEVEAAIRNFKDDLDKDKSELKNRDWSPND